VDSDGNSSSRPVLPSVPLQLPTSAFNNAGCPRPG
jgi:hypothetical protein